MALFKLKVIVILVVNPLLVFSVIAANSDADLVYTERVSQICDIVGDEAHAAVKWRESKKSLDEAIKNISNYYHDNEFMRDYAIKIWKGIYSNNEIFKLDNARHLVVETCVISLMQQGAKSQNTDTVSYACKNMATTTKQLAELRDKGVPKAKMQEKIIASSKKGDSLLQALDYEKEALEEALSGIDYVFLNRNMNPGKIYSSYLIKCISSAKE